eukprot:6455208-Amphidinium_carterae.2
MFPLVVAKCYLQASVAKIHHLMGKASKGICVQAACLIAGNEYWSSRMTAYINDLPAHFECETALRDAFSSLESLSQVTEQNLEVMGSIFQRLPDWRGRLRSNALAPLEKEMQAKFLCLMESVLQSEDDELLQQFGKLMAEALIVFPMQKELVQGQEKMATLQAKAHQNSVAKKLEAFSTSAAKAKDLSSLWEALQAFVSASKELTSKLEQSTKDAVLSTLSPILAMAQQCFKETNTSGTQPARILVAWFQQLATLLSKPAYKTLSSYTDIGLDMYYYTVEMHENGHPQVASLQALKVSTALVPKVRADVNKALEKAAVEQLFVTVLGEFLDGKDKFIATHLAWWKADAKEKVETSKKELVKCMAPNKKWKETAKTVVKIPELQALAKDTLLQVPAVEVENSSSAVSEASQSKNT